MESIAQQLQKQLRASETGKTAAHLWLSARRDTRDMVGRVQLVLGREPTVTGSARLALEQWKAELSQTAAPQTGELLFAAIRNRRWVEWAVYSACYLLRMGYRPTVLFSGEKIAQLYGTGRASFWAAAQSLPYFQWVDLDPFMTGTGKTSETNGTSETSETSKTSKTNKTPDFDAFAREGAHTVAAYDLEVEEYEADQAQSGEYEPARAAAEIMLRRYAVAADQVLRQYPGQRLICPSGLISESLAVYEAAQRLGHEAIYVEGWALRPGHNLWNVNRPALEFDIEGWMRSLGEWSDEADRDARDYMAFREGKKIDREGWLDNFHQVQRTAKDKPLPPELEAFLRRSGPLVLLGTNVVGDSATLRRQTIFRSQQDWLEQTIAFFRQHPELNLIVRAHPDEVWARARLRIGNFARQYAGDAPNIFVVGGEDDVNTYSLIDVMDVGSAWVSNVGLDMALRGKPVVMAARPKYAGLGVVQEPSAREDYFRLLTELAANPVGPNEAAMQRGKAYHHIVFKLLSLESDDRQYNAANYRLGDQYRQAEQHKFYRILAGELDNYGR